MHKIGVTLRIVECAALKCWAMLRVGSFLCMRVIAVNIYRLANIRSVHIYSAL